MIDTHCHFSDLTDAEKEQTYARARADGVQKMIDVSFNAESAKKACAFSRGHDGVYFTVGTHPDDADEVSDGVLETYRALSKDEKCVAVGEIGLDYHRDGLTDERKRVERDALYRQIVFSDEVGLPVSIHLRDANKDFLDVIAPLRARFAHGGVMHCYGGSKETAKTLLDYGFYFSFTGVVTFSNAESVREVCAYIPNDRVLTETDSPYMAPVPLRGTVNEPKNVRFVYDRIAEVKGMTVEDLVRTVDANARRLFYKIKA